MVRLEAEQKQKKTKKQKQKNRQNKTKSAGVTHTYPILCLTSGVDIAKDWRRNMKLLRLQWLNTGFVLVFRLSDLYVVRSLMLNV